MEKKIDQTSFINLFNYCLELMVHTAILFDGDPNYKNVRLNKQQTNMRATSNFEDLLKTWRVLTYNKTLEYGFELTYDHTILKGKAGKLFVSIYYSTNQNCFFTRFFPLEDVNHTIDVKFIDEKKSEEAAQEIYKESVALQDHYIQKLNGQDS